MDHVLAGLLTPELCVQQLMLSAIQTQIFHPLSSHTPAAGSGFSFIALSLKGSFLKVSTGPTYSPADQESPISPS